MSQESVFEKYAHEYDLMTNAKERVKPHSREVEALIEHFGPTRVLDAGCANGLTTSLFAKRGIEAVGLDKSRRMIAEAKARYGISNLPISFRYGLFERLPKVLDQRFDLVVCLANALSGLGTKQALRLALAGFKRVLRPSGGLAVQILNYRAVREGEVFPVKATQQGRTGYLRFVRRTGRKIELTMVRLDLSKRPFGFEVFSHEVAGLLPSVLTDAVRAAGFRSLRKYGNLRLESPFRQDSRDLILLARKPA